MRVDAVWCSLTSPLSSKLGTNTVKAKIWPWLEPFPERKPTKIVLLARHRLPVLPVREFRKVDIRLPGKGNSNSRGARPVYSFR